MADNAEEAVVRRNRVVILLRSRNAWLPTLSRRDFHQSGFVHHAVVRESCSDCLANDRRMAGCETCRGRGYVDVVRERDPYAIDKVQPYGMSADRHEKRRERDAELERLTVQTRDPFVSAADEIADANKHPYLWERERDRHYRQGDYAHLDRALEWLRFRSPQAVRLAKWVYEFEVILEPHLAPEIRAAACMAVDALAMRMPDPIRVPPWLDPSLGAAEYAKRRAA